MTTDATRDEAAKALAVLCDKTPRAYPDWDYGRVVAFKEANAKARRVSRNARASAATIQEHIRALEHFHDAAAEVA